MSKFRKKPTPDLFAPRNTHDDPHFEWPVQDRERSDYVLEVMERTEQSKPRCLGLKDWDSAFVRLVDRRLDAAGHAERGANREHEKAAALLVTGLTEIKTLRGPSTEHAIDEMAARLLVEAQNFGAVIESIRRGAHAFATDGLVRCVGLTRVGFDRRMQNYRGAHVRQPTSHRINAVILEHIGAGTVVEIYLATPPATSWNGLPVTTAAGLETGLIELFQPPWNMMGVRVGRAGSE